MTAADYADLARLAEAATKGEWARQPDDGGSLFGPAGGDGLGQVWGPNWRRNVDYIVAANPATILRLIEELDSAGTSAMNYRDRSSLYREERDELADRLAAVEALADEWEERYGPGSRAHAVFGPQRVSIPFAVSQVRAVLSAAPTDTKENQ